MRHFGGPTSWARFGAVHVSRKKNNEAKRQNWFNRRATEMRNHPTSLETKLELILDSLNINHKRQYILGNYIVDFYLPAYCVVVEADGPRHEKYDQRKRDDRRDKWLIRQFKCRILHLRCHEFFSAEHLKKRIMEFITGVSLNGDTSPAQEGFQAIDDCGDQVSKVLPSAAKLNPTPH